MTDRVFLDTNVLVYSFDRDAPEKQTAAHALLREAGRGGRHVISTQVLQEFFVAVTRKLAEPLSNADAARAVELFAELPTVAVDVTTIRGAMRRCDADGLSFWDALIVQTALENRCTRLLTEDLQEGRVFDTCRVENPFLRPDA